MGSKLKVLQVFGSLNMGGAESRMMDVYRHLNSEDCQFDFLCLSKESQYYEEEIKNRGGIVIKIDSPRKVGVFTHIVQLREVMRRNGYDAVHAHTSYHCGIAMLAAWLEHIPVRISHSRTTGSKRKGIGRKLAQIAGSILVNIFSTHRIAISKEAGYFLFGNHTFEVLPNAIDLAKYKVISAEEIKAVRNSLSLKKDTFIIGQVGRFDSMKNHGFTVEWFSHYLKENHDTVLIFVGDGVLKQQIQEKVQDLNIQNNVIFTGIRNDVHILMNVFNVLLFPSKYEGLGGVAIEAQAAGTPCVMSDRIPAETDLGLGLVVQKSLESPLLEWSEAVNNSRSINKPEWVQREEAFNKKGYSLSSVIEKLLGIYRSR